MRLLRASSPFALAAVALFFFLGALALGQWPMRNVKDPTVTMDVPGLQTDDLEIELENDVLTVRGERAYPHGTDGEPRAWQRIERGFGKFERSLQIPRGLDPDAIEASLDAGVLTLRIPKPEKLKPKRVQIAAGNAEGAPQLEGAADGG